MNDRVLKSMALYGVAVQPLLDRINRIDPAFCRIDLTV